MHGRVWTRRLDRYQAPARGPGSGISHYTVLSWDMKLNSVVPTGRWGTIHLDGTGMKRLA